MRTQFEKALREFYLYFLIATTVFTKNITILKTIGTSF